MRILLVEDAGIVARDIERQLRSLGHEDVSIATSGEDAVAFAGRLHPQLVLMDIHLSGAMDGIDAAIAIRETWGIPCVFLAAYTTGAMVERARRAEPLGYIIKPFAELSLRTTLEIALHKDHADHALRQSESQYRAVVQSATDAIVTARARGDIVGWSPAAGGTFGYTEAEILGQPLEILMPAKYRDQHRAGLSRMASAREPGPVGRMLELEGQRKDGTVFPIEITLSRWEVSGESFATAVIRDITTRRQTEASLRLQGAALNAAANAIVITDRAGTIEWVNPAFSTLTGYGAEEAIGRNPGDLLKSGKHDRTFYAEMWRTLLDGRVWDGEITNRRKDGTHFTEEQTITPVRNGVGEVTHFVGVKRDITDQKRMQEQLLQAQKLEVVGRLAGGVAHDFNNLLTVINGTASLALRDLPVDDPSRTDFALIKQAGDHAAQITRQLLAVGRRQLNAPQAIDLGAHLARASALLQGVIGESIALVISASDPLGPVLADASQLDQVLLNLAVNARDAMPAGGVLSIEARPIDLDEAFAASHPEVSPGPHVMMTVTDTGSGMSADVRGHVFEPFYTTKDQSGGTGLGLATVYGIVTRGGGAIVVESEPGTGACFKIFFRLAASPVKAAPKPRH